MSSILVFDAEIENAIPEKDQAPIPGIKYCKGWHDHAGMGISVMGAYSTKSGRNHVYINYNKDSVIEAVETHDLIVGFNSVRFDAALVKATWGYDIPNWKHYDIYLAILKGKFDHQKRVKGYSLDPMAQANLGIGKTGNGAEAPIDWQQGRLGNVIDYCLNDINITWWLFCQIMDTGTLIDPLSGVPFFVAKPMVHLDWKGGL
jgi:hypothetical protein